MNSKQSQNFSQSFMFNDLHVRGNIVKLTDVYEHIISLQQVSEHAADILGQVLAAAAILIQPIKTRSDLTIQFQSQGVIKLLAVKVDTDGNLRATINCTAKPTESLIGNGYLVVTVNQHNIVNPHQSIIEIHDGQTISQALTKYFDQSEQMPTLFYFAYNSKKVAGIMIQQTQELVEQHDWETLCHLFSSITEHELLELDTNTVVYRLFNQFNITMFPEKNLAFECACSLEKMQSAIMSLGKDEALEILQDNHVIEVSCDYCKNHYGFDKNDINQIFSTH
jgi:molecular chaperone Hsp33